MISFKIHGLQNRILFCAMDFFMNYVQKIKFFPVNYPVILNVLYIFIILSFIITYLLKFMKKATFRSHFRFIIARRIKKEIINIEIIMMEVRNMSKTLRRLGISFCIGALLLNFMILPASKNNITQVDASTVGTVNARKLHIRSKKTTKAKCIKVVRNGKNLEVLSTGKKWVKVRVGGKIGYTQGRYISTAYGNASDPDANVISGKVNSKKLVVRASKSDNSPALITVNKGTKVRVLTQNSRWVQVSVNGVIGYAKGKNISTANGGTASDTMSKGDEVISYALRFVGNPYRWGGTSLTNGADCSGYIMSIYRHFGKSLPHSSRAMRGCGTRVSSLRKAKPGDIICYNGHVALYMGNNKIVHASNPRDGIKISSNASYRPIITIRRIFK